MYLCTMCSALFHSALAGNGGILGFLSVLSLGMMKCISKYIAELSCVHTPKYFCKSFEDMLVASFRYGHCCALCMPSTLSVIYVHILRGTNQ